MTRRQARENTGMAAEAVAACTTALETVKALVETNKARLAEIDNERQQLTGAALIDCDPLAKQRLDALSAETVAVKAHLENTMAAILEGEVRLQNAQARQAAAQQVENAQSSRALLAERQRLALCDLKQPGPFKASVREPKGDFLSLFQFGEVGVDFVRHCAPRFAQGCPQSIKSSPSDMFPYSPATAP
jgi:hypothetical protein